MVSMKIIIAKNVTTMQYLHNIKEKQYEKILPLITIFL